MLKKIVLAVGVVLIVLVGVIATRPAEFTVSRSRTLAAPPATVHALVNDFHKWTEWSPWEKRDPDMSRQYAGAESGPGAIYSWSGNSEVGSGRMTITESRPAQNVTIRLEFLEPFAATNITTFDFAPSGTGTQVTWTMRGENNFIGKAFSLFMNMDAMVGGDFEQGLANLDAAAGR